MPFKGRPTTLVVRRRHSDRVGAVETGVAGELSVPTRHAPAPPTRVDAAVAASGDEVAVATEALAESAERRERQRLEAELQRFRETTTETFERMPLGFVTLDREQRITYANPAALALAGMSLADVVGRRPWGVFPELIGTRFQTAQGQAPAGLTVEYEEYFAPRDLWVEVLSCPTSAGVALFLRDVADRRRAEDAQRTSEARLRGSLDAMLDPFVICSSVRDGQGTISGFRIEFANRAAGAFMGRAPDSLTGALIPERMPNLRGAPFVDACRGVVETGQGWAEEAVEFVFVGRDGDAMQGAVDIQISKFGDGFFAAWRDVSERERTRREHARLATIVEEAVDGIVIADADGRITYANPAFVSGIGRGLQDLVGSRMPDVTLDVLDPATIADIDRTIAGGRRWLGEVDQRGADATLRHVEISVTPGRDPAGAISNYVSVFRDVTDLREAENELALEARVRAVLVESLHTIPAEATVEQAAQAICEQLVTLPFVDLAAIEVFLGATDVQIIAQSAPPGYPVTAGTFLPPIRAAIVRERAASGAWAQYVTTNPADGWIAQDVAAGLKALAYGPIVHGDHIGGCLQIGTFDERFARTLVEKMPAVISFSATSSALLAERLHRMYRQAELRRALASVLASRSFHPVFQPIVDLETGETVGYEALTRFDSGQRPDLCFADAWSVGLGPELEIATVEAAVAAAKGLPSGQWLDVNISPRVLEDADRLSQVLWPAERPIVLEITEHEVIEDYGAVREAIRALGHDVRLAVDDAGAGVANFGHIIELRPDFVKLDISLVRRVNANLGRQAMVVGMRHFSRTAGCRLVAEGIETEEEAATLTGLGVEFGQGYLFGHPEPVEVWAGAGSSVGDRRQPMFPAVPGGEVDGLPI